MSELAVWCSFFGAWLLVAGPIFQASIELRDENLEGERLRDVAMKVPAPERISPWWWLIPPYRYWLERQRQERHRQMVVAALDPDDLEKFVSFSSKAAGWLFVATGGFLIATGDTWALVEHHDWPTWVFWVLVPLMAFLSAGNTALQNARSKGMRALNAAARTG